MAGSLVSFLFDQPLGDHLACTSGPEALHPGDQAGVREEREIFDRSNFQRIFRLAVKRRYRFA